MDGILELTYIILIAATFGIVAQLLKQPLILAYLVAGVVIGILTTFNEQATWHIFSDLGIMFLLFLVGLEINYSSLRLVGKDSALLGLGQVIITFIFGFIIAKLFGYTDLVSSYLAIALAFSSTIIIIKLLSEKRDLNSLYGKLSIGLLLVQDLIVILLLIVLAGIESGVVISPLIFVITLIKGAILFVVMLWLGRKILPFVFDSISRSSELLFLVSIAWVFVVVAVVYKLGFSIEIGGFLAGLALANSSEHFQIASKIKALRDFFIVIFFVVLGSSISFSNLHGIGLPIIVFSVFVLIGNPLIVMILMGLRGYKKRTAFLSGVTVAQISEFSLILAALGLKLGHISSSEVAIITTVGVVTIAISTYMITNADFLFAKLSPFLGIFEFRKHLIEENTPNIINKSILLIGCKRIGKSIIKQLKSDKVLIVEFDPEVIKVLKKEKYDYFFGDITDPDIQQQINFSTLNFIISTSPSIDVNLALLEYVCSLRKREVNTFRIIVRARDDSEAKLLYSKGADYVILPHTTSGYYFGKAISKSKNFQFLDNLKTRDIDLMQQSEEYRKHL